MAYWSIPAGQQIDYSANGDDIDSFSQKVKWSLEEIFNSLQYLHTNGSTGDIDAPAQAYEIRVDSSNGTLCIRNAANNDWITLGKLEEHFGIEPEDIGAIRNGGGIKKLDSGKLTIAELNAEHLEDYSTGDVYISAEGRAVYWFTGSTWKTIIASGDGSDILTKSILVNQGSEANAGKVLKINEHGKLSTDITGSPGMLYDKAIVKRGALKNNQVLVYDSTENGNAGAFVNREIDAVVGGGIGGGWDNSVVSTLQGSLTFKRNSGDTGYFGKYDGTADVTVLGSDLIGRLTLIQGESSVQYDGGRDATVKIPDRFIPYDLSITQNGQTSLYSGVSPVSITIPPFDTIPYDKYLTIRTKTGGKLVRYNGSEEVDVSLKPLTITQGKSTLEYDGGMAQEITIPSANQTLTIEKNSTKATYDGTKNAYIKLDNAKLVISQEGQEDIEYDGSAAKEITIPSGKTESLTITQGNSTLGTYDGSSVTSIAIPPSGLTLAQKSDISPHWMDDILLFATLLEAGVPMMQYTMREDGEKFDATTPSKPTTIIDFGNTTAAFSAEGATAPEGETRVLTTKNLCRVDRFSDVYVAIVHDHLISSVKVKFSGQLANSSLFYTDIVSEFPEEFVTANRSTFFAPRGDINKTISLYHYSLQKMACSNTNTIKTIVEVTFSGLSLYANHISTLAVLMYSNAQYAV